MNSTKYQVFISSTYSDLVEERESIIKAILEMYHIPIGMEMFSAEDEDQWEIIRRTIEVSDYYILVLGLRYGSKTSDNMSFTQKEYEYALEKKIPVLAFVMDEMVSLPKDKRDDDLTEMNNFRNLVLKNTKMAQFWKSKEELIKNVSISLMKQIMQKPAVGWVRGDVVTSEEALTKELTSLSKENRHLREKISNLESRISPKTPKIELAIVCPKVDENFNVFDRRAMPEVMNSNNIENHLREFVSSSDIEQYNSRLPTEVELENYNSELEKKCKIDGYSSPLVINVGNVGSIKANNLIIDITFPDSVLVYKNDSDFNEPNNPFPPNPIDKARILYQEKKEEALKGLTTFDSLHRTLGMNDKFSALSMAHDFGGNIRHFTQTNQNWSTDLNENKLTIKVNSLLHTREISFDDEYMIVPLTLGYHKIEAEIICEEYEGIKTQVIEMKV